MEIYLARLFDHFKDSNNFLNVDTWTWTTGPVHENVILDFVSISVTFEERMRDNIVPPSCRSKARSSRSKGIRLADEFVRESRVIHLGTCWQRNHVPRDCSCKVDPETIVSSMHLKSPLGVARKTEWRTWSQKICIFIIVQREGIRWDQRMISLIDLLIG